MKSFKTTPKLESNLNYMKNQQSDIFIQKGLNKPEIQYKHKKFIPKNTFKSSYNFMEWNDMSPHMNPSIKIKENPNNLSQILNSKKINYMKYQLNKVPGGPKAHKAFYEKMFENEPEKGVNKSEIYSNPRYQKETMDLGDYDGKEYKIKKNKSVVYDPSPYLKDKNPLKRKMDSIYGGCDDLIGEYKPAINRNSQLVRSVSSIGFARRDFETRNEYDPKIRNNPKEMKHFLIYGNKGIENANKKLKPLSLSSSTNNIYIQGEEPTKNRVNFLKSNIFNDEKIEKMNNDKKAKINKKSYLNNPDNNTIKVNRSIKKKKVNRANSASILTVKNIDNFNNNEEIVIKDNHAKRFIYKHNDEKFPNKLDWRDPQLYLLFPQSKNSEIIKKNARQRKFKEIYGSDPIIPKEKLCEEFKYDERPEIDEVAKNNYKNINYSKMKRISDNISQMQDKIFLNENKNNKNIQNNKIEDNSDEMIYEMKSIKNKKTITNNELVKHFAKKGIHIYDIREKTGSIINNRNDNKIEFKIKENVMDNKLKGNIDMLKKEFKNKGYLMNEKSIKKKESNDILPDDLKWNNPYLGLLTKNKNIVKTSQGITHSKPPMNKKKEEEKITRISVNLNYKIKPYHNV